MAQSARRLENKKAQAAERFRGSAHERGYDRKWRAARIRHLKRFPYCRECIKADLVRMATVVDHVKPHRGNQKLFWDQDNWQSLCKPCHDSKTARGE